MNLQKGKPYNLLEVNKSDSQRVIYVRREKFGNETEWETFYNFLGGSNLDCTEGIVNVDGILQRIRIPAESIVSVSDEDILFRGGLVSKLAWGHPEKERTSLVKSWIGEVEELTHQKFSE